MSGPVPSPAPAPVRGQFDASIKTLEDAQRVASALQATGTGPDTARLSSQLVASLSLVESKHSELDLGLKALEKERDGLRAERAVLIRDKERLELEQRYLSFGFWASIAAVIAAFGTVLLKVPTLWLERASIKLDIEEKRLALERKKKKKKGKAEGPAATSEGAAGSIEPASSDQDKPL